VHILTEAARLALDRVPCFFYTAQYQGTGKSLLSEMPATIVHGVEPALRDWVEGDELRKTLFSSVICGDRSIAFDNLGEGAKVRARELCKFITEAAAADRKLGESKILTAVNRAVVSLSGNNINPTGDLSRRALVVRMDANMTLEELKARVFEIENLRGHILERRPQLLDAALTIIRGYQQQHGHNGPPAMQSFENWSRMVRDPLIWLGMEDPLETQKQETEDDSGHIDDAFKLLARQYADRDFTATDVARIVGGLTDANGELGKTLIQAGCAEPNDTTKLGYWLRACRDKRGAGVKLVKGGSKYKGSGNIWRFEAIRKAQNPAAVPTDEPNGDLI
jgi:putative DNA primase/helicase